MSRNISHKRHAQATISAVLLACGLAFTSGCLEEDEVTPALESAALRLEALGAPGSSVPGDEFRLGEYRAAIATLNKVATSGSKVQNAEAALMIARAQVGLAEPTAIALNELNQAFYNSAAALRTEHAEWATLSSLAETAQAFDPAEEQAQINEMIQQRDAAIATEQEMVAAVRVSVAELEQLAEQAIASASALRLQEEEKRNDALRLSAQEALPLHEEAAKFRREADAFEVTAEMHMAKADTIRPEINDHEVEIARLTSQRDLLVTNSQEIAAKAVEGRNEAQSLREQSSQTAQRIDRIVSDIESLRAGEAKSAFDAMTQAFDTAASSAGKASSGNRTGSNLAKGEIRQSQANLIGAHASTLEFVASILNQVAETRTPLPNASTIVSASNSMQADAETHKAGALEAFIEARDAFDGASLRGEASDRIDAVITELDKVIESLGGPSAAPEESFDDGFDEDTDTEDAPIEADNDGNG
jgi:hypothetical protein